MAPTTDVEAILASLTLDEKISLLAGANFWETVAIPSKNVPSLKTSDGPNGARGAEFAHGTTAACFPASVCLASTFDVNLATQVGAALAEETASKGARVLLAPTVCLHRHPLGGRNFESFSEDPLLAGKLAAAYIRGLQDKGVGATIKHFAANEQETCRFTVNETISERALRELYLKPFEIAIKEADPWAVMTSYNLVNGTHADSSDFLLKKVLRGDWGWKGLVMSDWGGTNSTAESINAGMDLEMPGPTKWRKVEDVKEAIAAGKTSEEAVTERARNVLELLVKTKQFEDPITPPEKAINRPSTQKLIRQVGGAGAVLLKNEGGVLPIKKENLPKKKIALLGHAKDALIHGGGSASVNAHYKITPYEGLRAAVGDDIELVYAKGAHTFRLLPPMGAGVKDYEGSAGWTLQRFDSEDYSKSPVGTKNIPTSNWAPILSTEVTEAARLTGTFTPATTGKHYIGFSGLGPSKLFINGELVSEQKHNYQDPMGFLLGGGKQENFQFSFEAGKEYAIEAHSRRPQVNNSGLSILDKCMGFYLGFMTEEEHDEDIQGQAVAAAADADVAIVFTGHTKDWETEGQDQASFNLPANGSQDALITAVSAVNKNTIVVNSTGVAVAMPWIDRVAAVLQTWFPGQEAGNAIADVLLGVVNPSGRLPTSFPKRLEDAPAHGNFPGETVDGRLEVKYAEDVFIGYRHFDRAGNADKVLFPFGHGLSYTSFAFSGFDVRRNEHAFDVAVSVANTGKLPGAQVVQVYAGPAGATKVDTPVKQLVGFARVELAPGESKAVHVPVPVRSLAYFDEAAGKWVVEKGDYKILLGESSARISETSVVSVAEKIEFAP
ncbi:putative thermostable beta-glucosidase b protein [Neofusicoccum parvum UCRNP2]|uniref:beta-glucosidase n=1 Tax=Botryosphaeria parva (strain UCR-NP2) TaxID=1287680 RepID=R1GS65_BOTPV|nr:putative thermostable beta-glucosidase b protein [Neofusicoccum parvum UCRNP2]